MFFTPTTYSGGVACWQAVRDYKNTGNASISSVWWWSTYNPSDYNVDLTGYTNFYPYEWVAWVTGNEINDNAYIYLTLK